MKNHANKHNNNAKHIWFNFYFKHLQSSGSYSTNQAMFNAIERLNNSCENGNNEYQDDLSRLRKAWNEKRVEEKDLQSIQYLLVNTDFYRQLFDVSLIHRIGNFNSERKALEAYQYLRMIIHKKDYFWSRWLYLFCLRHEFQNKEEIVSVIGSLSRDKSLSRQEQKDLDSKDINALKERLFTEVEAKCTDNLFADMEIEDEETNEIYQKQIQTLNQIFLINLCTTKRTWLRNKELGINHTNESKTIQEIEKYEKKTQKIFECIENDKTPCQNYIIDLRMLRLYHYGTQLLGKHTTCLMDLHEKERQAVIEQGKSSLLKMQPRDNDTSQYRIWYWFYEFLLIHNQSIHALCGKKFNDGLKCLKKAKKILFKIEKQSNGRQMAILLKTKQYLLNVSYVQQYIQIVLLEKDLEQPMNEERLIEKQKPDGFLSQKRWLDKLLDC